jgi:hypothetical protein
MMPELSIPKLQPTEFERAAIEEVMKNAKPLSEDDLSRLALMGKQDPTPADPPVPLSKAELDQQIAILDKALADHGFVSGRQRPHRNRKEA